MNKDIFKVSISQEFLESAKVNVEVSGQTVPMWTGMTYLLSGGTNGNSVLTGLTIPIMFEQTFKDIGYYSGFDGAIYQKDLNNNFVYSGTTGSPQNYNLYLYNTTQEYAQDIKFTVDWGDGSPIESITTKSPDYTMHTYPFNPVPTETKKYNVSLSGAGPWGITVTTKNISIPYQVLPIPNEEGETFLDVVQALEQSEGIDRFRISSIEPNLLSEDIIKFVSNFNLLFRWIFIWLRLDSLHWANTRRSTGTLI